MMKLDFFKMQAQGNDYLFFDFSDKNIPAVDFASLSRKFCNRHFGVGADGIVLISENRENDAEMRIFNADGSEAEICGTALRCVVSYLAEKTGKAKISVRTKAGIHSGEVVSDGKYPLIKVEMGKPEFQERNLTIENFRGDLVSVGNPHFVVFVKDGFYRREENYLEKNREGHEEYTENYALKYGKKIETNPHFPKRTNVEFVKIISPKTAAMQIWERGSGITLACGTGATAAAFVGMENKLLKNEVTIIVPGGEVIISSRDGGFFLTGEVSKVFTGEIEI